MYDLVKLPETYGAGVCQGLSDGLISLPLPHLVLLRFQVANWLETYVVPLNLVQKKKSTRDYQMC